MNAQALRKALLMLVLGMALPLASMADVCVPTDPDYDPVLCALGGSGSGGPGGAGPGPQAVPVDGGATLLAAAGMAYAAKRFRRNKATKTEDVA